VPADHDRLGGAGDVAADPLEQVAGDDPALVAGQLRRGGKYHVEPGGPEVVAAEAVQLGVEPRRVDEGNPLDVEATQCGHGGCGGGDHGQTTRPEPQPLDHVLLDGGAEDVGRAGEAEGDG